MRGKGKYKRDDTRKIDLARGKYKDIKRGDKKKKGSREATQGAQKNKKKNLGVHWR